MAASLVSYLGRVLAQQPALIHTLSLRLNKPGLSFLSSVFVSLSI